MKLQVNIFISYRSKDAAVRDKILTHLNPVVVSYKENYGVDVKIWYDENEMLAGDRIEYTLSDNLEKSQIVLCVFTPNYFESDWCLFELKESANKAQPPGKKRLLPVLCEHVSWDSAEWLSGIKIIPASHQRPLLSWENQDEAFAMVAKEVDANIRIFADPRFLDFKTKQKSIYKLLGQEKPDLRASVKILMDLAQEHSPESIVDAIKIHVRYSTYREKESDIQIAEFDKMQMEVITALFEICTKIEKSYEFGNVS